MRNILLILLLPMLFSSNISAQVSPGVEFFPMQVGNVYVYLKISQSSQSSPDTTTSVFKVADTLVSGGKEYYYFNNNPYSGPGWFRVDSITGSLYKLDSGNTCNFYESERFIDSLAAVVNDYIRSCGNPSYPFTKCDRYDTISIFNSQREHKSYYYQYSVGSHGFFENRRDYTEDFGLSYYYNYSRGTFFYSTVKYLLKGCVINGIVYGDTASTSISLVSNEIPIKYLLSQNYPNPFNPSTTISFSIRKAGLVTLKVYNVLGEEVKSLVNHQLSAGSYDFDFDAGKLSSGIYFYTLKAGDFSETKKMMLVK